MRRRWSEASSLLFVSLLLAGYRGPVKDRRGTPPPHLAAAAGSAQRLNTDDAASQRVPNSPAGLDGDWAFGSDNPSDYVSSDGRQAPWFQVCAAPVWSGAPRSACDASVNRRQEVVAR